METLVSLSLFIVVIASHFYPEFCAKHAISSFLKPCDSLKPDFSFEERQLHQHG